MRGIILLFCFCFANAGTLPEECGGIIFQGIYHDKEVLKDEIDVLGEFSIEKRSNILFFSLAVDDQIKSAYLNLETKEFAIIPGIEEGFSTAIDQEKNTIYLGGNDGIYKFNHETKSAELFGAKGTNIWNLYFWEKLFYVDYPKANFFDYNFGQPKLFKSFENNFVKLAVHDNGGIFFVNETGLFHALDLINKEELYSADNAYIFLSIDNFGNVYVGRKESSIRTEIYILNKKEINVEKVAIIEESVDALAFDKNNNVVFNEADRIVRLIPNKIKTACIK